MASVVDVAEYILCRQGAVTAMKLQKLVYYAQAWALVWDDAPIFPERIEAWANGPVAPDLYQVHRGQFELQTVCGRPGNLSDVQRETVDAVLRHYGDKTSQWLSDLTHSEEPWRLAREGLPDGERGHREISHAAMAEYYSSL